MTTFEPKNEKEINERIGRRIQMYLNLLNMTQLELANKMGVSAPSVNNWIKGIKTPRMPKIDKICEILGVTRAQLMDAEEPKDTDQLTKAMELWQRYQKLPPEKQLEFQQFLDFLQSRS